MRLWRSFRALPPERRRLIMVMALIGAAVVGLLVFLMRDSGTPAYRVDAPTVTAPLPPMTDEQRAERAKNFVSEYYSFTWEDNPREWQSRVARLMSLPPGQGVEFFMTPGTYAACLDAKCVVSAGNVDAVLQPDGGFRVSNDWDGYVLVRVNGDGLITGFNPGLPGD